MIIAICNARCAMGVQLNVLLTHLHTYTTLKIHIRTLSRHLRECNLLVDVATAANQHQLKQKVFVVCYLHAFSCLNEN